MTEKLLSRATFPERSTSYMNDDKHNIFDSLEFFADS